MEALLLSQDANQPACNRMRGVEQGSRTITVPDGPTPRTRRGHNLMPHAPQQGERAPPVTPSIHQPAKGCPVNDL